MDKEMFICPECGKQFCKKGIGYHRWKMHGEGKDFNPCRNRVYGPSWSKGLTKETNATLKRISEQRKHAKTELEAKLDDDDKLRHKWLQKKHNAHHVQHIEFNLSFEEYCQLMDEAGIVSSQLGIALDKYVLARNGDAGPYSIGNCRFTTQRENMIEKNNNHGWATHENPYKPLSKEEREARKVKLAERAEQKRLEDDRKAKDREKFIAFRETKLAELEAERVKKLNPSYTGIHNSHYGTFWITNGSENKVWKESYGPVPEGFRKGRYFPKGTCCNKNNPINGGFWITDGIINKAWSSEMGSFPEGFHRGRVTKMTNKDNRTE